MTSSVQTYYSKFIKWFIGVIHGPRSILYAVVLGSLYGYFQGELALESQLLGTIYLRLLEMCVIPIVVTAIASRVGSMILDNKEILPSEGMKILRTLTAAMVLVVCVGVAASFLLKGVGQFFPVDRDSMGKLMTGRGIAEEVVLTLDDFDVLVNSSQSFFKEMMINFFPQNVFEALANFYAMQLAIFAILLGVAIGLMTDQKKGREAIRILDVFYDAFYKLVRLILNILSFGLFFLIAGLVSSQKNTVADSLQAMGLFILSFYVFGCLIIFFCSYLIWLKSYRKVSWRTAIFGADYLMKPVSTAFATMNSFATLPVAIEILKNRMGYEEKSTTLYLSLFLPLLRFGNAFYFIVAAEFFAFVYKPDFSIGMTFSIVAFCLLISFTTIGTTSVIAIQPITLILESYGLPGEVGFLLLVTIDPLVDPMRTTLIVHCNTTITALLADRQPTDVPVNPLVKEKGCMASKVVCSATNERQERPYG